MMNSGFMRFWTIVWQDEFNADRMAEYMRRKLNLRYGDNESPFGMAIDHYQTSAWAVRDFLKYSKTASMKSEHGAAERPRESSALPVDRSPPGRLPMRRRRHARHRPRRAFAVRGRSGRLQCANSGRSPTAWPTGNL